MDTDVAVDAGPVAEPKRGRPSVIDRERIGKIAFELWDAQGYAATSWADIAAESGVSVRTLTRHFSSPAELVSTGLAPAVDRLRGGLERRRSDASPSEQLRALVVCAVRQREGDESFSLVWQRVLAKEAHLRDAFARVSGTWTDAFADVIADVLPEAPAHARRAIAAALHAAAASALLDWAQSGGEGEAADAVAAALAWFEVGPPGPA